MRVVCERRRQENRADPPRYTPLEGTHMLSELIGSVRRNHALEHATITVMLNKLGRDVRMVGRATRDGYYLYADVPTELLGASTYEALQRLKSGEGHLAVSPLCGTNLAAAGALAGIASTLTLGN